MQHFKNETNHHERTFEKLDLTNEELHHFTFEECKFIKCDFSESQWLSCRLIDCEFINCNVSLIKLTDTSFNNVVFDNSKCVGINWSYARWPQVKLLSPINFHQCDISLSSFYSLCLKEITIENSKSHEVDFRECDLSDANLAYTDFLGSQFVKTNIESADFSEATNYDIDIHSNRIKNAKFSFPEVVRLLNCLDIHIANFGD